jgi:hypothetical protein
MMVARFRVATRATGRRREVYVHVYDDQEELARAHAKTRGREYNPDDDVAGGVSTMTMGYHWPHPDGEIWQVMRLWTGQLTTRTIAHEATHAAACMVMYDAMNGWDARLRTFLNGDNEAMAYAVGDITAEVVLNLYRLKFLGVEVRQTTVGNPGWVEYHPG